MHLSFISSLDSKGVWNHFCTQEAAGVANHPVQLFTNCLLYSKQQQPELLHRQNYSSWKNGTAVTPAAVTPGCSYVRLPPKAMQSLCNNTVSSFHQECMTSLKVSNYFTFQLQNEEYNLHIISIFKYNPFKALFCLPNCMPYIELQNSYLFNKLSGNLHLQDRYYLQRACVSVFQTAKPRKPVHFQQVLEVNVLGSPPKVQTAHAPNKCSLMPQRMMSLQHTQ